MCYLSDYQTYKILFYDCNFNMFVYVTCLFQFCYIIMLWGNGLIWFVGFFIDNFTLLPVGEPLTN